MAGHRMAGDGAAEGFAIAGEVARLPPPARIIERRFLAVITGGDGEFVVANGADDVAGKIFAAVLAEGFSVEETEFAAELNAARGAQIGDAINGVLAVSRRNVGRGQGCRWIEGWQKFLRGPHRTEGGGEKDTVSVFERQPR